MSRPQYLSSADPDVIAIVERNRECFPRFRDAAVAWGKERGFDDVPYTTRNGDYFVTGLPKQPEGFGQWTKPNGNVRSTPYRTNTVERDAMAALTVRTEVVPGMPAEAMSDTNSRGEAYFMRSAPFVHEGKAWVGWTNPPEDRTPIGEQWSECYASEFYAAREAVFGR